MKLTVMFGSQRSNGTWKLIEESLNTHFPDYVFDFIRMHEVKIKGCLACEKCSTNGICVIQQDEHDMFNNLITRIQNSDVFLVITPIYSPYPSKLTAFMERALSISFFPYLHNKRERPLKGKLTGVFSYGSSKIEDETQLKLLLQKLFVDNYSFTEITYKYINNEENPNKMYPSICDYVIDTINNIKKNSIKIV